jgi:cardiolipin synthase (CMP-forming)
MPAWLLPPNLITYLRLVLAPMAAMAVVENRHQDALMLVFIAGVSDGLDGFLARQFNWHTRIGRYLDPLADKLLLVLAFVALTVQGSMALSLLVFFLLRDVWILSMVAFAWVRTTVRDFPPRLLGKATTLAQILLALTYLVRNAYPRTIPAWWPDVILLLTIGLTALSLLDYTINAWQRYRLWRRAHVPPEPR